MYIDITSIRSTLPLRFISPNKKKASVCQESPSEKMSVLTSREREREGGGREREREGEIYIESKR